MVCLKLETHKGSCISWIAKSNFFAFMADLIIFTLRNLY